LLAQGTAVARGRDGLALARADGHHRALRLRRCVMTLMMPLTALTPHSVPPGPLITSMRSTSSSTRSCTSQKTPENSGV
jgi:hypothetical protein